MDATIYLPSGVGAAISGIGLLGVCQLIKRKNREVIDGDSWRRENLLPSLAHLMIFPVWPQFRASVVDILGRGLVNTVEQPFVTLGPNWGTMPWLYISPLLSINASLVGSWACQSARLSKFAAGTAIIGGLVMTAFAPFSGYKLDAILGLAMLFAKPAAEGQPYHSSSGWWLGVAHKLVAAAHCLYPLSESRMIEATRAIWFRGFFSTSEMHGIASIFRPTTDFIGPVWGIAHFYFVGLLWWVRGSHIQDWAMRTERLRPSSALASVVGQITMHCIIPSSGYGAGLPISLAMLYLQPTSKLRKE